MLQKESSRASSRIWSEQDPYIVEISLKLSRRIRSVIETGQIQVARFIRTTNQLFGRYADCRIEVMWQVQLLLIRWESGVSQGLTRRSVPPQTELFVRTASYRRGLRIRNRAYLHTHS